MTKALIPPSKFVGLDGKIHLAAGGETPMLKSHHDAVSQFMHDKAQGESGRRLLADKQEQARKKCARLLSVKAEDVTFLSNSSEGINNVAYGLDWKDGDNVVVADVEFPSGILPWTKLKSRGVEIRIVKHRQWVIDITDIEKLVDERTRVVAISHVSMYTGQRICLKSISELVRASNAMLLVDATHSAGVVPVDGRYADVLVSSCYKFLLGTHGTAIFYVNRDRLPDFEPPFLGWNSPKKHGGWQSPTEFLLQDTAHRFQPGNAGFISIYILDNALDHILAAGIENIENHDLTLSGEVLDAARSLGFELMTPLRNEQRAANVCLMADDLQPVIQSLSEQGILIWGAYAGFGRLRISTHVYNDSNDVNRCIDALQRAAA